jgi:pilus assembly protein CpaB
LTLERDIALADERDGGGLALDADLAQGIPLVGFGDDEAGFADVSYVGFAEDDAASQADAVVQPARPPRPSPGAVSRHAARAVWAAALALFQQLRLRLTGTHLSVRRLRAAGVVVVALLIAVGIGVAVRAWLPARLPERIVAAPAAPPPPAVLVATQPIGRGRILRLSDMQWQPWPLAAIKPSYFRQGTHRRRELQGYVARAPIAVGQPVSADDVVAPAGRGFLASMLKPGMRAISVGIGPETAASGLILPGDEVDVLLSLPVPAFDTKGQIAEQERASVMTLLRNIQVLAIDQETEGHDGRAMIGKAATLEVTPKEAEIVTLANELALRGGMLVLALRSISQQAEGDRAVAPSHLLDTDVSKLLTDRPVTPANESPRLAIVRRATLSRP